MFGTLIRRVLPPFAAGFVAPILLAVAAYAADEKAPEPPEAVEHSSVGDPLAPGKVAVLIQEIVSGIRTRNIESQFLRWRSYAASRLNATAGRYTGSELTGNCRLKWYDSLLRNPLRGPVEAEQFTRHLHEAALNGQKGFARMLTIAREKMDLPPAEIGCPPHVTNATEALQAVREALSNAQSNFAQAVSTLSKGEINELATRCYPVLTSQNKVGHTLNDRGTGRRLCDLLEKLDRDALHRAAEAMVPLLDPHLMRNLAAVPAQGNPQVAGVTGRVLQTIQTPAGLIVVGGPGKNVYRLDEIPGLAAVIDVDGDDEYYEGVVSIQRPVLVVIDVKGNDVYRGTRPGVQGSAILGVSFLLDNEGDDVYHAQDVAQASCIAGVGILIDNSGDDVYQGIRRVQGQAFGGLALLLDRDGHDRYRAAMWAQGFGGPLGFGLLDDADGNDHYFAGGMYLDSYPETPGMEGWSQGVGAGPRQVANGGLGVILDGGGDDLYEFDYLSHGGGYWCGMGFARDFGGDDRHLGSTSKLFTGGARSEPEFQRFGNGYGCHYSLGFCFDDAGDDVYRGRIMGIGHGWDLSVGVLCDFNGNDRYESPGTTTQGTGAQASIGMLYDYDGDDTYVGYGQGYAAPGISYHDLPGCGGNFSFVIDHGGEDKYGCGVKNNSYNQRGASGGFVIDRPKSEPTAGGESASSVEQAASSH